MMLIQFCDAFFESTLSLWDGHGQSGYVVTDEGWVLSPMYAPFSRIYFVLEGSGVLRSDDEEVPLEGGYVYLAPLGAKCGFCGTPSVCKLFFHINLRAQEGENDVFSSYRNILRLPYPVEKMKKMKERYLSEDVKDHLFVMSELYRVIYDFCKNGDVERELCSEDEEILIEAMQHIRTHLCANLTVNEVAEAVHCSRTKLHALFKDGLRQSVSGYIEQLLMSEAQTLLMYSNLSIGQISDRLGFCDQFYFSRWFSKHFSVSPKKMQKAKG